MYDSILELIGNTPLVKLRNVTEGAKCPIYVKVEYLNPGGSSKDRIALRMVNAAEKTGLLKPGGTIIEPTSGNTGVGLAIVAQQRGYKCIFVVPDKVSEDKINVLRAYGAQVEVCPTAVDPDDPKSYYSVSDRLVKTTPNSWKPDQYSNINNPLAHYETTGPEIWKDTQGKVTHFVAGMGTGGTISGTGKFLKEISNNKVKIIGADPVGSIYSGGTGRPYLVEGIGEDFWPTTYDTGIADLVLEISDTDSFQYARRLAKEEGLLVGGSCGTAVAAAIQVAQTANPTDLIVVLLPDGGRGYLSKLFNDDWLRSFGFLPATDNTLTVGDVLNKKTNSLPELIHTHPQETLRDAINIMTNYGVSQLPVVRAEPPVKAAEVVGTVKETQLMEDIFTNQNTLTDSVASVMGPPLPFVGVNEPVTSLLEHFTETDAVLVVSHGNPVGVLTRQDILEHITTSN